MRPKERIDPFLEKFGNLWKNHPDMRFGQLVEKLVSMYLVHNCEKFNEDTFKSFLWNAEENEWEEAIDTFYGGIRNE